MDLREHGGIVVLWSGKLKDLILQNSGIRVNMTLFPRLLRSGTLAYTYVFPSPQIYKLTLSYSCVLVMLCISQDVLYMEEEIPSAHSVPLLQYCPHVNC